MQEENNPPQAAEPVPQDKSSFSGSRFLLEMRSWFRDILFAFATAIFIVVFVIQPVKVEGTSMLPRLIDQERIFVNRFIYRFTDIHRGDIVVFWYPRDRNKSFIKRVVGVPGDELKEMALLNGVELNDRVSANAFVKVIEKGDRFEK